MTERVRTFGHQPYLLEQHLDRLRWSLEQTRIAAPDVIEGLPAVIDDVVRHNAGLIAEWQDLAIVTFVSPGLNPSLMRGHPADAGRPTVCVHTTVLPVPQWAALACDGVRLVTPSVRHIGVDSVDPRIKHRSRLHWFLADQAARRTDPQAAALLLNATGHVTETATGNLMVFDGTRLLTPRPEYVLDGISQRVVTELASAAGLATVTVDLTPADVIGAQEAFLTSTGYCLLPVTQLNGRSIGAGRPGPLSARLLADWSARVGVDILAQHQRAADEPSTVC